MFVLLFNYTINPIIKLDIPLLPLRPIYSVSSSAEIRYSLWGRFIMSINTFLGMVRPPWRPQIGLYEKSVSVLRAWFFEHFIHLFLQKSKGIRANHACIVNIYIENMVKAMILCCWLNFWSSFDLSGSLVLTNFRL
ncbi:unnamed protein product [Brassica napus]|uniref:(rape) hypothetical protein n=1 Tax=Brassica napus TaxID=3708 RepID=A0A816RRQ4_BRANA|nr:unnamed protein product [Brassica napus]